MLTLKLPSVLPLSAFTLLPTYTFAQPSSQISLTHAQPVAPAPSSANPDSPTQQVDMSSQSSHSPSPFLPSFLENLSRHWTQAGSTKQTFMAILLIIQIVAVLCFIKRSLDKVFGRRIEYRGQRTKHFARRAAVAAAGGSSKFSIPLSHQRPLYRNDNKPQLPPRPTQNHPLLRPSQSSSSSLYPSAFQTTSTGDIILPSWTEAGPTPLKVIVEEPEDNISRSNTPLCSRSHSPVSPIHQETPQYSWSFRNPSPRDSTSLRQRNDYAVLPFSIDRSSTPDTRLEEVKRPFNCPSTHDDRSSYRLSSTFNDPRPASSLSPA